MHRETAHRRFRVELLAHGHERAGALLQKMLRPREIQQIA